MSSKHFHPHHDPPPLGWTPPVLTLEELSRRTGESVARLKEWRSRGLIGNEVSEDYTQTDIGRAHLVHDLVHHGVSLDEMVQSISTGGTFRHFLDEIGLMMSRPMYTVGEALELSGLKGETGRRMLEACGLSDPAEMLDEEDLGCLRACKIAIDAGYPEEALEQILRVYAETMSKAADVGAFTSHFYLHRRLQDEGLTAPEMMERLQETGTRIEPLVEPALLYFHRRGMRRAGWEDMLMHLQDEIGVGEKSETLGQLSRAVMFVDLAGFTPLAEAMGDVKADDVLQRFSQIVRNAVRPAHGRIVKQIGDAFMVVFPECDSAVGCAVYMEDHASRQPQFPAMRAGLHWGPVLYREGDYFGSNVNIAARLANEAGRHQVLVTDEVRRRARRIDEIEFVRLGKRRLKGLSAEVEIFEAKLAVSEARSNVLDPVCGMELSPAEVAASLTIDAHDHHFCSDDCLKKFVRDPERYQHNPHTVDASAG